ncbi:serine/threonine-protein kinase PknH/PknJ [Mycobacterium sp. SP-6446]|uniref:serine/threonine-protein kinase PknH/PknJ n=1 Tax=Mycobacterium sp. SP-6446 TaxID=1834162 RepID=UPI00097010DF|nr:serine/threonine-protein kinase PknH/PknJ [Mycobacterium sp. SP-6446]OMC17218.1 serine/threonine protein kinase [Mycobacterium sp. SP-6446]
MLTVGSVVGGYRVERVLGTGGMGAVYLAADPGLPRHIALKVLSAQLSRDPDFRARFIREADMAAALDHPQIVSVYNRGQTEDGQLWIAMQFVDGTDADAALHAGTMSPQRVVHILVEVAKALDFAHARNVVHRDVKPANFLLSGPIGPGERVLLGDFGVARALDDVGLTATNSVMATVAYAAPEVLSNSPIDGRIDIYSLGCTMFRLLTGKTPFPDTNGVAGVMAAHLFAPPPRVTEPMPWLPVALDHVVATAMAKDPAARFPSAGALAEAAAAALHDRPVSAPLPPVPSRKVRAYPRTDSPARPGWEHGGPRTMTPWPGPPARRRRRTLMALALSTVAVLVVGTVAVLAWPNDSTENPGGASRSGSGPQASVPALADGPPATDITAAQLRPILLTTAEIAGVAHGDTVTLERDGAGLLDDAATIDNQQCLPAWAPAQQSVYANSAYTGVAAQELRAMYQKAWQDSITQAVIAFPSQDKGGLSYISQREQWGLCGGKAVTITAPGEGPQVWEFGQPFTTSGVLTISAGLRGGNASCQHGMMERGNVIIDIVQCHAGGGADVGALVTATAAKVPRQ